MHILDVESIRCLFCTCLKTASRIQIFSEGKYRCFKVSTLTIIKRYVTVQATWLKQSIVFIKAIDKTYIGNCIPFVYSLKRNLKTLKWFIVHLEKMPYFSYSIVNVFLVNACLVRFPRLTSFGTGISDLHRRSGLRSAIHVPPHRAHLDVRINARARASNK